MYRLQLSSISVMALNISRDLTPEAVEQAVIRQKQESSISREKKDLFLKKRRIESGSSITSKCYADREALAVRNLRRWNWTPGRQVLYYVEAFRRYLKGMEQWELTMIGPSIGFRETKKDQRKVDDKSGRCTEQKKCEDSVARGRMEAGDPQRYR